MIDTMFEFFISLFGGLFYGNKYRNEKAKLKAFDERQKAYSLTRDDIEARYVANYELEKWAKDFILSGQHLEDICNWFAEDFRYVFGAYWKNKLQIPPKPPVLNPQIYKQEAYSFMLPVNHITWVYHLLLAKKGKIDHGVPGFGYPIGGINEKDMTVKFAECIEGQLLNAGVRDIRLALELDMICGTRRRTASDLCGGNIKIESLCHYPTHRLWNDYVQK